jgi:PTH2 family peptidyl-tRNA hydrolase
MFKKICVSVNSEQELLDLHKAAVEAKIINSLIQDSGLTEFGGVPTYTTVAIGPDFEEKIDAITKHLPLL